MGKYVEKKRGVTRKNKTKQKVLLEQYKIQNTKTKTKTKEESKKLDEKYEQLFNAINEQEQRQMFELPTEQDNGQGHLTVPISLDYLNTLRENTPLQLQFSLTCNNEQFSELDSVSCIDPKIISMHPSCVSLISTSQCAITLKICGVDLSSYQNDIKIKIQGDSTKHEMECHVQALDVSAGLIVTALPQLQQAGQYQISAHLNDEINRTMAFYVYGTLLVLVKAYKIKFGKINPAVLSSGNNSIEIGVLNLFSSNSIRYTELKFSIYFHFLKSLREGKDVVVETTGTVSLSQNIIACSFEGLEKIGLKKKVLLEVSFNNGFEWIETAQTITIK
ncbi:hypothetical protein RFI_24048 [Reticulomyxa filosa]|uniref:Uncharacterized protein n=1 Tax=Reticulomyxa filosa TaxID=46433 RepID=X6MI51_RETFI|nr:hypothetical protein RFI_24048 [Reticulomyxa filosa]|eukprot:ETO13326.1 hypothetical protein RFI_24048 [Reticulomyxa filosa]